MTTKQRKWTYGLVAGFLGGMWASIDSGLAVMIIAPKEFNLDPEEGLGKTIITMGVLGVLAGAKVAVAYLKQSPLPPMEGGTEFVTNPNKPTTMKILFIITGALAVFFLTRPAHGAPANADPYAAGQFSVSPFASYRVHEFGQFNGKFGLGLAAGYSVTRNLTLEAWTLSEAYESAPVIDSLLEAGVNLKFYAPLKESGLAPYAIVGYSRGLESAANNMEAGLGLEYRFPKHVSIFADAVWVQNFGLSDPVSFGHAKARAGLAWRF